MFLGHINDLNNAEWKVLPHLKEWALYNNQQYSMSSNVCPHQGSLLKDCSGKNTRACPFHGWSFKITGEPLGSGTTSCANNEKLENKSVYIWNGFIFSEPHDLPSVDFLDTTHLQLEEMRVDRVNASFSSILHLFLDVDHIPVVHPKVYSQLMSKEIEWEIRESSSVQLVPVDSNFSNDYIQSTLPEDRNNKYGAGWFTVYPYSMLEWQPGAWFITVCNPVNDQTTDVTVYKYRDKRYSDVNWELNQSTWETAWSQDRAQSELLHPGFKSKYLELPKIKFNEWVLKNL